MIDKRRRAEHVHDATCHTSYIFPSDTNLTCTFTAHANANVWSAQTIVADNAATQLSAVFTDDPGHITAALIETISDVNAVYMFELSWGASYTVITRMRFAGATKFVAAATLSRFWAPIIPAGEQIYYRMKTETAVADTCTVHFRYHIHV